MSKVKSIQKYKVFFLTDVFIDSAWYAFFPEHVHHLLTFNILEFSV